MIIYFLKNKLFYTQIWIIVSVVIEFFYPTKVVNECVGKKNLASTYPDWDKPQRFQEMQRIRNRPLQNQVSNPQDFIQPRRLNANINNIQNIQNQNHRNNLDDFEAPLNVLRRFDFNRNNELIQMGDPVEIDLPELLANSNIYEDLPRQLNPFGIQERNINQFSGNLRAERNNLVNQDAVPNNLLENNVAEVVEEIVDASFNPLILVGVVAGVFLLIVWISYTIQTNNEIKNELNEIKDKITSSQKAEVGEAKEPNQAQNNVPAQSNRYAEENDSFMWGIFTGFGISSFLRFIFRKKP